MSKIAKLLALLVVAVPLACSKGQKVTQGKVVAYDAQKKTLVVEEEKAPNPRLTLDTTLAEFGSEPKSGNIVRVVYKDTEGRLFAGRVMNVTAQREKDEKNKH